MENRYNLIVLGDINLDWVVRGHLSYPFTNLIDSGKIDWMPIDKKVGGSGLNFARFAKQEGHQPLLLGKVGNDPEGDFVLSHLKQEELDHGVLIDEDRPTGMSLIAKDSNNNRFLVNNSLNANQNLSIDDIQAYRQQIQQADIVYASGYCFMNPEQPRTDAARDVIRIAKESDEVTVVFDVVPHAFYQIEAYNTFAKFQQLTADVDILISEISSIRRFLKLGERHETITEPLVRETYDKLKPHYDRFVLRWGPSGCDHQAIWDATNNKELWEDTKHHQITDQRGFGDRLALKTLREVYGI